MYRRSLLGLVAVPLTWSAGCLGYFEGDGEEIEEITEPDDVAIVWDDLVRENPGTEDERAYVWGVARNEGDRRLSYVEIEATFHDDEDERLDSVIEHVEDVTSGGEWAFEIEYPRFGEDAARVDSYDLEVVTGV